MAPRQRAGVGAGLTIWSYHEQGNPWWESVVKGLTVSAFAYVGSAIGAAAGFAAGAAIVGPDVTGVPEVAGAVGGGIAGGTVGGGVGSWFVNLF